MAFLILMIVVALGGGIWWFSQRKKPIEPDLPVPPGYPQLLEEHVGYYQSLPDAKKAEFADRVTHFLQQVTIEGVETTVDDLDKVLVASSAIIPIFGFAGWDYYRLTNVLLYGNSFNTDFDTVGTDRNILGMVGEGGALQSTMVLSKPALHQGFDNKSSKSNTGIHEFVHLLDQTDGATDGLPEFMLDKNHVEPWLKLIHRSIGEIKANHSDIDPYGITNEAEFFAVVSEYFFKRPDLLQQKHPELFSQLEAMFRQNPAVPDKETESV